jgi:hypothetical protein
MGPIDMSGGGECTNYVRRLLLEICRMERVTVVYGCECGQRLILTNFRPSLLHERTEGMDVLVLQVSDEAACPECGASLVPVWHAAEMTWVEEVLAKLASLDRDSLAWALEVELHVLEETRLRCN